MSTDPTIRIGDDDAGEEAGGIFAPPTEAERASGGNVLESLRKALQEPVVTEPKLIRVPGRPGVSIRCHTRMTQDERKAWQRRATKKRRGIGQEPEVDEMQFAELVIANTCEAILFNGVEAHDAEDTPLTFRHRQLWEMVGANDPALAIRNLFGVDAHVLLASGEVLLASGFDDELSDEDDPTRQDS